MVWCCQSYSGAIFSYVSKLERVSARFIFIFLYVHIYGTLLNWHFTLGKSIMGWFVVRGVESEIIFSCVCMFSFCIMEAKNYLFAYFHHVLNLYGTENIVMLIQYKVLFL